MGTRRGHGKTCMTDRAFLDTNILVYAHDAASPEKKAKSQQLIFQCLRDGLGVISPQVLSEFFVTVTRKVARPLTAAHAKKEILLLSSMATVDIDATLVIRAVDMREQWQLNYWDALILVSAERADCGTVYSEDLSDGQRYGNVTVRNPY